MGLNQNQKRAVEYLSGPLLVLAGPGTGKTQLLSHKVAYILANTDTSPENILCLTFTDSGAKNMRERLKTIIGKDALRVNIGTYHAFGSEILGFYKNYSEDYERRLDAAIDEVTQYKIVKEIQSKLPGTDILRGDPIKDIISVISEAKAAGLSPDDLKVIAKQNIADASVLSESISPLLLEVVPRQFEASLNNAYRPIFELLSKYTNSSLINLKSKDAPVIERTISSLARDLKEAIVEAESTNKIKPLSDWKDSYFEKDANKKYRLKDRIANKKLLSISYVMKEYEEHLSDNGLFDFGDMIGEAVKVLRNDEGFKASLQERYQFILLDEFQDTNPAQFTIVKELTDYENPMIMAVGDDDQAIYEFQGALSSNLTDFQKHYSAEVIPLIENYRSTQEILDFSREVIRQAPDRFADKELFAHKGNPDKSQIYRYEFNSSDAEYGFVAAEVAKLIKSGISQKEIAIISYKTKYFEPLLPYLKQYPEIKIAYDKRDNLFEDEKIHQILILARYIFEVANEKRVDVPVLEVLTLPFFKLPIIEVIKLSDKAKKEKRAVLDLLSACEIAEMKETAEWISTMVRDSFTQPLDNFLSSIVQRMDVEKMEEYERFRFYENLAALKGHLKKYYGDKPLRLIDLIEMVNDYDEAGMALNVTSPYRDAEDAVSILTAHKAKGLEFSYVFIISADHTAWGKGKGNNSLLTLPRNLMQIRHTGITDGEKLRILYVALTRAKTHLYITNSLYDFNGKNPDRLEYLEEYIENDEVISPFLPDKKVRLMYQTADLEVSEQNIKNWLAPFISDSPDMRAIYKERVSNWRMSASALTSFIDIAYSGPQEFFKNYILQAPREPETESMVFGTLVHKVFETVTNKNISDEEAVSLFISELSKYDLPVETIDKMREKGPADIIVSLRKFKNILHSGKAEVDFGPEKLVINGIPVTGKIDHLLIDENNKTVEVFDYKTGGYHKEKWQSHLTLYKYMLQLEFYKLLLNNSPKYSKYKVEKAHILFVAPDKDGEVYDKEYFYDDDNDELKNLMSAVYNTVTSLDFIDDKNIFIPADSSKGIKEIKDFITLILAKIIKT